MESPRLVRVPLSLVIGYVALLSFLNGMNLAIIAIRLNHWLS